MLLQNITSKKIKKSIEYAFLQYFGLVDNIIITINSGKQIYIRINYIEHNYYSFYNLNEFIKDRKIKINLKNKSIFFYEISMREYYNYRYIETNIKNLVIKFNDYGWKKIINYLK